MKRIVILLLAGAYIALETASAALPDLVVFDEDDSVGVDYYDASFGFFESPSFLELKGAGGEKLVVEKEDAYRGLARARLTWQSMEGGQWRVHIASQGWRIQNGLEYVNLILRVNGPYSILPDALPEVALESASNSISGSVPMADYLEEGVDADSSSWQTAVIPLQDLAGGNFPLSQIKSVVVRQDASDGVTRTLWLDDIRISVGTGLVEDEPVPDRPAGLSAYAGDRAASLHWLYPFDAPPAGFHVYRADNVDGPFERITSSWITIGGYADTTVENGRTYYYRVTGVNNEEEEGEPSEIATTAPHGFDDDEAFLDFVQRSAFEFFWHEANPATGLIRDRSEPYSACSIASVGFGLSGIAIGIDRQWITREQGRDRTLTTLRTLWELPQGDAESGTAGHHGWFYHFLDMQTGQRARASELSSIDTGLLLAGVLDVRQFFDAPDEREAEIRLLAGAIFDRVDWQWMANGGDTLTLGWYPDSGFLNARWRGYNEAMILYILALGANSQPLPSESWDAWTRDYEWETDLGPGFLLFPPLFGHQYSHAWIDFRHLADDYMRKKRSTYFINSRWATLAQQDYAVRNRRRYSYYGDRMWGFTASDGPGVANTFAYIARGAPPNLNDDGTIAPTAVAGSLPFAPDACLPTLRHFYEEYRENIWTGYGFRDAFNLSVGWWGPDIIGIDQGAILLMIENYRAQSVWRRFMRNPEIQRGLNRAGFQRLDSKETQLRSSNEPPGFRLSWSPQSESSYQVEYSEDLELWRLSPTGILDSEPPEIAEWIDSGPPHTQTDPGAEPRRFYRVYEIGGQP